MTEFFTTLLKLVDNQNFPMFVSIFLLVKVGWSMDAFTKELLRSCNKIDRLIGKMDEMMDLMHDCLRGEASPKGDKPDDKIGPGNSILRPVSGEVNEHKHIDNDNRPVVEPSLQTGS